MKLKDIKVCVEPDCEEIVESDVSICPRCTSSQFMYLDALGTALLIARLRVEAAKGDGNIPKIIDIP
jgi:RNA polymerase subunit RPABC4/transcription elongation factor Spt4